NPGVTLTARPASGTPRVCSACFIRMPGTLEMPPAGKSAGTLNLISTVWIAGSLLSVLRRSDQVIASFRSGTSTSARMTSSGRCPGPGVMVSVRQIAEPTKIGGILLVEHHLLRGTERRRRLLAGLDTVFWPHRRSYR